MKNLFIITWDKKSPLGFDFNEDVIFNTKEEAEKEVQEELFYDGVSYTVREVSDLFLYLYAYLGNTSELTTFTDDKSDLEKVYDFFENVKEETLVKRYLNDALYANDCIFDRKEWIKREIKMKTESLSFWLE